MNGTANGVLVVCPMILPPEWTEEAVERWDRPVLIVDNTPDSAYRSRYAGDARFAFEAYPENAGVARAWNRGLAYGQPLTLIVSQAVVFRDGLAAAVRQIAGAADEYGCLTTLGFHAHAWTPHAVEVLGRFDENEYPAYLEDSDWLRRAHVAGVHTAGRPVPKVEVEGAWSVYARSKTWLDATEGGYDYSIGQRYYRAKWGGDPGHERFATPFGRSDVDLRWWPAAPAAIEQRAMHRRHDGTLTLLAGWHETDKREHGYCPRYETHLAAYRGERMALLEVGVHRGGSLRAFRDWLPYGQIVGVDTNPDAAAAAGERIVVRVGDATDPATYAGVPDVIDVVIDDGSHRADDVTRTFTVLWPRVAPGGWYVIEDLDVAWYEQWGGGPDGSASTRLAGRILDDCLRARGGGRDVDEVHAYEQILFIRKVAD